MMHLFINALAATAGGGITYIRNVIPHLTLYPGVRITAAVSPQLHQEVQCFSQVKFLQLQIPPARRFWYEQRVLPALIRHTGADVLLSAGNFALRKSPVPQILLSRNSIYTSADYYRDLLERHEWRMWLDTRMRAILAKKSVRWADVTVAPSRAFAEDLRRWSGADVMAIHHGFDRDAFTQDSAGFSPDVQSKLDGAGGALKLLFVSHYNYYRNFETLVRSLPLLRQELGNRSVKLLLTCRLEEGKNPGAYRPSAAARLIRELGLSDMVLELGTISYQQLHHLYATSDIYVTPAYTETFAHPLVEAMASGVPIVASDIAVHREICENAALFFDRFSPGGLAKCILRCAREPNTRSRMIAVGLKRSQDFSWKAHTEQILALAQRLLDSDGHPI